METRFVQPTMLCHRGWTMLPVRCNLPFSLNLTAESQTVTGLSAVTRYFHPVLTTSCLCLILQNRVVGRFDGGRALECSSFKVNNVWVVQGKNFKYHNYHYLLFPIFIQPFPADKKKGTWYRPPGYETQIKFWVLSFQFDCAWPHETAPKPPPEVVRL